MRDGAFRFSSSERATLRKTMLNTPHGDWPMRHGVTDEDVWVEWDPTKPLSPRQRPSFYSAALGSILALFVALTQWHSR